MAAATTATVAMSRVEPTVPAGASAPASADGLQLHWDAAARSSLRDGSGNPIELGAAVGDWVDVAQGVTASAATAGYRALSGPTYTIVDGQPALQFNGTTQGLTTSPLALFTSNASGLTVIAVIRPTDVQAQRFLLMHATSNCNTNLELGVATGTGGAGKWGLHRGCSGAVVTPLAAISPETAAVVVTRVETTGSNPDQVSFRINGAAVPSATDGTGWTVPGSYPTATDRLRIGWRDDLGDGTRENSHFQGAVREILIFDRPLSDARLVEIEQHLSEKWIAATFLPGATGPVTATEITTTSATLAWSPPPDDALPISAYDVTVSAGASIVATCSLAGTPPATSCVVTGLEPATHYSVSVSATNDFGVGEVATTTLSTASEAPPETIVAIPSPPVVEGLIVQPETTIPSTAPPASTTTPPGDNNNDTTTPSFPPVGDALAVGMARGIAGGATVPVELVQRRDDLWSLIGRDFRFDLRLSQSATATTNTGDVILLRAGARAETSGEGFQPYSPVDIWLFSQPTLLGRLMTDASGTFVGDVELPGDLAPGPHTLQVNGISLDGLRRSLSMGVLVATTALDPHTATLPATGSGIGPWLVLGLVLFALGLLTQRCRRPISNR